jgi:hypothetical protein
MGSLGSVLALGRITNMLVLPPSLYGSSNILTWSIVGNIFTQCDLETSSQAQDFRSRFTRRLHLGIFLQISIK